MSDLMIRDVLKEARRLITQKKMWNQHQRALDKDGYWVNPCSPNAVCWCPIGAIEKVCTDSNQVMINSVAMVLEEVMEGNIVLFNDTRSHREVLRAFDHAICLAP